MEKDQKNIGPISDSEVLSDLNKPLFYERKVKIEVTPQARRVLALTEFNEDDLINDYIKSNGFSIGGHNLMIFLERQEKKQGK